jgi:hypothetical protein
MKSLRHLLTLVALLTILPAASAFEGDSVPVPSHVSHESLDRLLQKYVNDRGLVAYAAWKNNETDLAALDAYLTQFAAKPTTPATGNDQAASLINLYNATTIRWIIANYPTASIQALPDSFGTKRHDIGGAKVSLNDIEHGSVRPLLGYRAHAVLVCAARSCPPLQRFAYTPDQLDEQIDTAYRAWLSREDLNRFLPAENKVEISGIFNWFAEDFEKVGGVKKVLAKYAPEKYHDFLAGGDYEITYLPYNWGLNDQGATGEGYSRMRMIWDRILDVITFWN